MTVMSQGGGGGGPSPTGLADVIETILDKGMVIDAYVRVSLVGIENPRRRVRCKDCQPPAVSTTGASLTVERQPSPAGAAR